MFITILLFGIISNSYACVTQQECLLSIHDVLVAYDARHARLELTLARHLYEISIAITKRIIGLNSKMLKGPPECANFLENTLDHYITVLNATCRQDPHQHIPHDVWDKFQSLNPTFFDVTDENEVIFVCDIVITVLNDFCNKKQEQIDILLGCNLPEKFDMLFEKPWVDCVDRIGQAIEIEGEK